MCARGTPEMENVLCDSDAFLDWFQEAEDAFGEIFRTVSQGGTNAEKLATCSADNLAEVCKGWDSIQERKSFLPFPTCPFPMECPRSCLSMADFLLWLSHTTKAKEMYVAIGAVMAKKSISLPTKWLTLPALGICLRRMPTRQAAFAADGLTLVLNRLYERPLVADILGEQEHAFHMLNEVGDFVEVGAAAFFSAGTLHAVALLLENYGSGWTGGDTESDTYGVAQDSILSMICQVLVRHGPTLTTFYDGDGSPTGHCFDVRALLELLDVPEILADVAHRDRLCQSDKEMSPTWSFCAGSFGGRLCIQSLGLLARRYAGVATNFCDSLEQLNILNPTSDGGGQLEKTPLGMAMLAYLGLCKLDGSCDLGDSQIFPCVMSAHRLVAVCGRAAFVVMKNGAPPVGGDITRRRLLLMGVEMSSRLLQFLELAQEMMPALFTSMHSLSFKPEDIVAAVLEAVSLSQDIVKSHRKTVFAQMQAFTHMYQWPARFNMLHRIQTSTTSDAICGAITILIKDDWWTEAKSAARRNDEQDMQANWLRLKQVLKFSLGGDVRACDGMDTITTCLNLLKLVLLSDEMFFYHRLLLGADQSQGMRVETLLKHISTQVDIEIRPSPQGDKQRAMRVQTPSGNFTLEEARKTRVELIAFLLAEVREVISHRKPCCV
eukprot:Polyplicarium_translucidae@DN2373_c0_g1_i1.p2